MEDKLRAYMDHLFRDVKPSRKSVELKEEILQNLVDKYHDLLSEGKSKEAAFNIAVASIGDTEELLAGLDNNAAMYPGGTGMDIEKERKKSAILTAVAVMMYIVSVVPIIILENTPLEDMVGVPAMLIIIAVATGLLIFNYMTRPRYHKTDDSIVEEFKEWQSQSDANQRSHKAIKSALWALVSVAYILISFTTMAWHITWVIFLIGWAIEEVIKAMFELRK